MSRKILTSYEIPAIDGRLIRRSRKAKQMSQEKLAERVKVTPETIIRVENRVGYTPTNSTLEGIAKALDIPPVNFFHPQDLDIFFAGRIPAQELPGLEDSEAPASLEMPEDDPPWLDATAWQRFRLLPGDCAGKQYRLTFQNSGWNPTRATTVVLFKSEVEPGRTVQGVVKIKLQNGEHEWGDVYAGGDVANAVLELREAAQVEVTATAVYGFARDFDYGDGTQYDEEKRYEEHSGFVINRVIRVIKESP